MNRLEDSELSKPPSEVLEIICKLGKGSYGSVFKARYKATGGIVAVKKVPVDSDLADIVKEISIMQQCDSPFIVKCYGSLFDSQDLWICMEYCGAGSVADIMRLRGKPLGEEEIATVLQYSLQGLDYLHQMRKIHRDIKAGNILLLNSGKAKLADFGVAGQLSDTLAKRNTVIGTPYWMAPEVIQEIGYNCSADIWSLGITAIEMADGKPPLADVHPMRALFMIPSQPAPGLRKPAQWSPEFRSFVTACLVKTPEARPTAAALLQTDYIRNAKPRSVLLPLIEEANTAREKRLAESQIPACSAPSEMPDTKPVAEQRPNPNDLKRESSDDAVDDGLHTMVRQATNKSGHHGGALGPDLDGAATLVSLNSNSDTGGSFVRLSNSSSRRLNQSGTSYASGNLDTMVVNDAENEEDSGSVVVHDTASSADLGSQADRDQQEAFDLLEAAIPAAGGCAGATTTTGKAGAAEDTLTRKVNVAMRSHMPPPSEPNDQNNPIGHVNADALAPAPPAPFAQRPFAPFSRALQQGGFYPNGVATNEPGALGRLSYHELEQLLVTLTNDLETELRNLAVRYRHKRQPLLDAIAEKTAHASASLATSTSRS